MSTATTADRVVRVEEVMGTVVSFDIRDMTTHGEAALSRALDWLHAVDATFSTYRRGSVINQIGRGELDVDDASCDVRYVLRRCEELRRESGGYFDAMATGVLDPSALVKGWSVERAARILSDAGLRHFCITGGGDVVCRGGAQPFDHWRVGIQHPRRRDAIAATLAISGCAVATSGTYERGEHIRDPHTNAPSAGVASVSVVGPDLGTADAYSTAAFAMGEHGPRWLAARTVLGYESLTVLADDTVLRTPGFPLGGAAR